MVILQHAIHDVLVGVDAECLRDDARNPWTAEPRIARVELDDGLDHRSIRSDDVVSIIAAAPAADTHRLNQDVARNVAFVITGDEFRDILRALSRGYAIAGGQIGSVAGEVVPESDQAEILGF